MKKGVARSGVALARLGALAVVLTAMAVLTVAVVCTPSRMVRRRIARVGVRAGARATLSSLGIRIVATGPNPPAGTLVVANHLSWLDIVVVLASWPSAFVAKREVKGWPFIGVLGDAVGAIWIDRRRPRDLLRVVQLLECALQRGDTVMLFPEGTTTNGQSVLPFKSGLFEAAQGARARVLPLSISASALGNDVDALCWDSSRETEFLADQQLGSGYLDVTACSWSFTKPPQTTLASEKRCSPPVDAAGTQNGR